MPGRVIYDNYANEGESLLRRFNARLYKEAIMNYNNVLVGTDGTVIMDAVFDECAYLVWLMGATSHVAYVSEHYGPWRSADRRDMGKDVRHCQIRSEANPQGTAILLEEHPAEEMNACVKDRAIDLIIIGTHGMKGLDRLLIGNLTDKLIRTATVQCLSCTARKWAI
jgi:nucleotide-binding universal stress UspA family protein